MESLMIRESYRNGALGALMDEYERAAEELKCLVEQIPDDDFVRVADAETKDEDCRSAQTIMSHVVRSGYGYADYIREKIAIPSTRPQPRLLSRLEALAQLEAVLQYMRETLEGKWEMSGEEIESIRIKTRWGAVFDPDGLMEHAVMHILRHRRQLEKFIWQGKIKAVNRES